MFCKVFLCMNVSLSQNFPKLKGLRPLPPTPADSRIFGFLIFRKMCIFGIFRWDLGSGRVCNRLEMAVGFKWTDSQLISSHIGACSMIFMISMILLSFPIVGRCFRKVPGPSESALSVPGPYENKFRWSDAAPGMSRDPPRVP